MSPRDEAYSLYNKMVVDLIIDKEQSKLCALVAVNEIIKQFVGWYNKMKELHPYMLDVQDTENYKYWQQVAREINNL